MDAKRAFKWGGYYTAVSTVGAVLGLAIAAVGVMVGIAPAITTATSGGTTSAALGTAAPGLVIVLVGLLVWRFVAAVGFYKTMTGAVDEEMRENFDSERVKSDILAVLDDRLADMQYEIQRARSDINDLNRKEAAEEFEFGGD